MIYVSHKLTDCFLIDARISHPGLELRMSIGSTFFCCALWTRGWPTVRPGPLCIRRTRTRTASCGCSGAVSDTSYPRPTTSKMCNCIVSRSFSGCPCSSVSPSSQAPTALSSPPPKWSRARTSPRTIQYYKYNESIHDPPRNITSIITYFYDIIILLCSLKY